MCDPIWKGSRDREVAAEQVLLAGQRAVEHLQRPLERLGGGGHRFVAALLLGQKHLVRQQREKMRLGLGHRP